MSYYLLGYNLFLIEHLTHQKGPEQLSADHSALISSNQLISNRDTKNFGIIVQELQWTDFDEITFGNLTVTVDRDMLVINKQHQ